MKQPPFLPSAAGEMGGCEDVETGRITGQNRKSPFAPIVILYLFYNAKSGDSQGILQPFRGNLPFA
jgi:hypothetical protein